MSSLKSFVMRRAHVLRKAYRCSMADALHLAWCEVLGQPLFIREEAEQ